MKKIFSQFLIFAFIGLLFSCASTGSVARQKKLLEPEFTMETGKILDENWAKYYDTNDEIYLENIIAYADTEDLFVKSVNADFKKLSADEKFMSFIKEFNGEVKDGKVEFPFDFELISGFLLRDSEMKESAAYIYSLFPMDLLVRGANKSAAFWSLCSNAEQYENINIALQKHIPFMREKVRNTFYLFGELGLEKEVGYAKSAKGAAVFTDGSIAVSVLLVRDIKEALGKWTSVPESASPEISTVTKVTMKENLIAPFIAYKINDDKVKFPVYYDVELVKPDGTISNSSKSMKNLLLADAKPEKDLIYTAPVNCGFAFDESDEKGSYTIRVSVYTKKNVIAVFDLDFKLEK